MILTWEATDWARAISGRRDALLAAEPVGRAVPVRMQAAWVGDLSVLSERVVVWRTQWNHDSHVCVLTSIVGDVGVSRESRR